MAARKIRAKAQMIAAYLLEVHDNDVELRRGSVRVKGAPEQVQDHEGNRLWAAYNQAIPGLGARSWKRSATTIRPT